MSNLLLFKIKKYHTYFSKNRRKKLLHLIKKTAVTTFALILMISMSIVVIPIAIAHDPPWTLTTFAYISIAPQTIGVNQQMLVYMWLQVVPPTASGDYGDRWHDFTIEITRPDGTVETKGGYDSDPIGFASATYTPTQVGEYQFKFIFPGQTIAGENLDPNDPTGQEYIGDYYKPSESEIETRCKQLGLGYDGGGSRFGQPIRNNKPEVSIVHEIGNGLLR